MRILIGIASLVAPILLSVPSRAQGPVELLVAFSNARSGGNATAAADAAYAILSAPQGQFGLPDRQQAQLLAEAAASLADDDRDDEAITAYASLIERYRATPAVDRPESLADWLFALADLYARNDDFGEAAAALAFARNTLEATFGTDHPNLRFVLLRQRELAADRILFDDLDPAEEDAIKAERDALDEKNRRAGGACRGRRSIGRRVRPAGRG